MMEQKKNNDLTVACYTFPGFHPAALNKRTYGTDWDEYSLIRAGRPWYPGHSQPKQPTLGELDESKPETWEIYNNLASAHGIDVFIHDWYWWQGGPALHEALEEGFLKSSNCDKMKFAVMWTNHGWGQFAETMRTDGSYYWPPVASDPSKSSEDIYRSFAYIISRYMHLPNYWRIDGKPVLVVFQPTWLDSDERSGEMVEEIRILAKKMGHPDIHLHASYGGLYNDNLKKMGYDSYGHYNPVDEVGHKNRPEIEEIVAYSDIVTDILEKFLDKWNSLHEPSFFSGDRPRF